MSMTSSTSTVDTLVGRHIFQISGYSLIRKEVQSGKFPVGGYQWFISFCPDSGSIGSARQQDPYIVLVLLTPCVAVRAYFSIGFQNQVDGSTDWLRTTQLITFVSTISNKATARMVIKRSQVEGLTVLREDRLTIVCDLAVIVDPRTTSEAISRVVVPPPELPQCMAKLLEEGNGADMTFIVGEETFLAHRVVLAMRSPVFQAELYGSMREERTRRVVVQDMQPAVFKALLHFIYTDSLSAMDALDRLDKKEIICHMLVAADRYAMDRLKTICQGVLSNTITIENVMTTLALADQHNCCMLKDACIEFILL
ncbi:hypothetical protein PR202_ga27628 [Eleusine coracana subsp. coracana]|uniref:BTB domain-containing protein n=1 Tax=Eleusine coracana subsp. coracana TaxID=191504 RepID=A0AAV5DH61_ELECO|nr:hypothetical protein QOZ80_8AG0622350 [Eleusine coracana subsp. coracana]GJN09607.1 hypothetical protein PR202_ga27628 [Eleusine coracana subsp. coracana]